MAISVQGDQVDTTIIVTGRAWFAGLERRWETGPNTIHADTCETIAFSVPQEAFLHPLATEYVTDLLVRVVPMYGDRPGQSALLPVVYAVWANGSDQAPVVWDRTTMNAEAPGGVIDPTGRFDAERQLLGANVRILPPIAHELNLQRTDAPDDPSDHVTVPADLEVE